MKPSTGIEIQAEHERLEREAATILGFVIFEYSRLEMELGWMLSWINGGAQLEEMTEKFESREFLYFSRRLTELMKIVEEKFSGNSEAVNAYGDWITGARAACELRNQLFHGRWGFEAVNQRVVNVIGLPHSPNQKIVPYSLPELQNGLESIRGLRSKLQDLKAAWPI